MRVDILYINEGEEGEGERRGYRQGDVGISEAKSNCSLIGEKTGLMP